MGVRGTARDDIDDAANCIGAKQCGPSAFNDFDAFDHFRRDMLYRRATNRSGIDAHAVDQYQRVVAFGAAQKYGCRLPRPAIATDVHASLETQ